MARILLIEDEKNLQQIIQLNLELEQYEVTAVDNGEEAINRLKNEYYDLLILDLMLPKVEGMDVLQQFRLRNNETPVIIISARDTSSDRIAGLKTGADDYLTKPFEIEELIIRIEKLLKRNIKRKDDTVKDIQSYSFGANTVNFKTFTGTHEGQEIDLKPKELHLLKLLITRKNEVVSRHDILKAVWGYDVYPSTRTIDNFISSLRKHFETDPKHPQYIQSVRGIGYKFVHEP